MATLKEEFSELFVAESSCEVDGNPYPGWAAILRSFLVVIRRHNTRYANYPNKQVKIRVIRQKWGEIDVILADETGVDGYQCVESTIDQLEELSAHTCSDCGKPGGVREHNGWATAYCDSCCVEKCGKLLPIATREIIVHPIK
jgi:hypothetical protein